MTTLTDITRYALPRHVMDVPDSVDAARALIADPHRAATAGEHVRRAAWFIASAPRRCSARNDQAPAERGGPAA